jgi:N-acetylglucosaminyldiphosphoundecaprenol N-acetyl-beta-D-mannosaminyltransferase
MNTAQKSTVGRINILGCRVDNVTWDDVAAFCQGALEGREPKQVITLNGEHILAAQADAAYREVINRADLNIPDSTNVVWVSKLKGTPLQTRTPGVDFALHLCAIAQQTGSSVFLLGGKGETAKRASDQLRRRFPKLKIAGTSNRDPEDLGTLPGIKEAKTDIVLVAYGAPAQEMWIARHKHETGAKILVGLGGTFDMLSGILPRAPRPLRALHLEWLWRLVIQPSRIGRIWRAVVIFPLRAVFN